MYKLTLDNVERQAFDWVGGRYGNGTDMADLISQCDGDDSAWDGEETITYNIPEHIAWQIKELAEQDDMQFPCFASELKAKMINFCMAIV